MRWRRRWRKRSGGGGSSSDDGDDSGHEDGKDDEEVELEVVVVDDESSDTENENEGGHGNDRAEATAIARLFGDEVPPFSSTKRVFGHTLGAAGAIEAVASILSIQHGFIPPTPGFEEADDEMAIEPVRKRVDRRPARVLITALELRHRPRPAGWI